VCHCPTVGLRCPNIIGVLSKRQLHETAKTGSTEQNCLDRYVTKVRLIRNCMHSVGDAVLNSIIQRTWFLSLKPLIILGLLEGVFRQRSPWSGDHVLSPGENCLFIPFVNNSERPQFQYMVCLPPFLANATVNRYNSTSLSHFWSLDVLHLDPCNIS
jgi:hypothetical protein